MSCTFGFDPSKKPDAGFGMPQQSGVASVLRSMESASYYSENNIALARRWVSTLCNDLVAFETNRFFPEYCGICVSLLIFFFVFPIFLLTSFYVLYASDEYY